VESMIYSEEIEIVFNRLRQVQQLFDAIYVGRPCSVVGLQVFGHIYTRLFDTTYYYILDRLINICVNMLNIYLKRMHFLRE